MLQRRGPLFDNRDARFLPFMSPLSGGRDLMNPLARMGRGVPFDLIRGGGFPGGIWGGRGALGRDLFSSHLYGNRPGLGRGMGQDIRDQLIGYPFQRGRYPRDFDNRLEIDSIRRRLPYDFYRDDLWPHGPDCDACQRERRYHENQGHYGRCGCHRSCESSNSNSKKDFDFKTKDITIRGKARAVRASYLAEAGKFEGDLVKFMEKKKEEDVPDRVIDMLISYINREEYSNNNPLDEVTLNILSSNVGAKSAVDYSLGRFKTFQGEIEDEILSHITGMVLLSSKVDDGLRKWLKKHLLDRDRVLHLERSRAFNEMLQEKPELAPEIERLLGWRHDQDPSLLRIL
jgi:hypothetical protein